MSSNAERALAPRIAVWAPVFGPLTLALTGTIYLAGYVAQVKALSLFGLHAGMFTESLQATLARGYFPVLLGSLLIGLFIGIAKAFDAISAPLLKTLQERVADSEASRLSPFSPQIFEITLTANRWLYYSAAMMLTLALGGLSGQLWGKFGAEQIMASVQAGCTSDCFAFVVEGRTGSPFIGRVISADSSRVAVYSTSGIVMFELAKLQSTVPYSPALSPAGAATSSNRASPAIPPHQIPAQANSATK